ncbi:MAG: hypothetical protein N3B21_14465 [Clostridia bacterium]|nr:hypothetical protein [Clostridia bacterium]
MRPSWKYFRKITYIMTAIIAGILLFVIQTTVSINAGLLNPGFHKYLFEKHEVYSHTRNILNNSMKGFIDNFKKESPENYNQHKDTFVLLENSLTPEMVKVNLDSIREGIFKYCRGERTFLPDIYFNTRQGDSKPSSTSAATSETPSSQMLTKIEKINLSAVLLYIDRNDITHYFMGLKLIYYIIDKIPGFLLLLFLLLFFMGLVLCKKFLDITRWLGATLISCGVLSVITGIALLLYTFIILTGVLEPITNSIPMENGVIISYIRSCTFYTSLMLIVPGILILALSFGLFSLPRFFPSTFPGEHVSNHEPEHGNRKLLRYSAYGILFTLILTAVGYKYVTIRKDFESNDFPTLLARLTNSNTVTQVIAAKNDAIYSLQVKLLDSKTSTPVKGVRINIAGDSAVSKKHFNEFTATSEDGIAKFVLDKGTFRLNFPSSSFPAEYQLPAPFSFDLKSASTTIITINLETIDETYKQMWGIAEIEVLDKDNKPVPDVMLEIEGLVLAPGLPDKVLSYTNAEGIAVFKINEGNYKISFPESKLPKDYLPPSSFDISVSHDTVTRYTIRLSEKTEDTPATPSEAN